jgi:hypothetical protein
MNREIGRLLKDPIDACEDLLLGYGDLLRVDLYIQSLEDKIERQEESRLSQFDLLHRKTEECKKLEQEVEQYRYRLGLRSEVKE